MDICFKHTTGDYLDAITHHQSVESPQGELKNNTTQLHWLEMSTFKNSGIDLIKGEMTHSYSSRQAWCHCSGLQHAGLLQLVHKLEKTQHAVNAKYVGQAGKCHQCSPLMTNNHQLQGQRPSYAKVCATGCRNVRYLIFSSSSSFACKPKHPFLW